MKKPTPEQVKLLWEAYAEYAKQLRTWLVAYGIGAPILFLSRAEIWDVFVRSTYRWPIGLLFLCGVALQIGLAAINKWSSWRFYTDAQWTDKVNPRSRWSQLASWLVDQFWIDVAVDILTIVAFLLATALTLYVFFSSPTTVVACDLSIDSCERWMVSLTTTESS